MNKVDSSFFTHLSSLLMAFKATDLLVVGGKMA
jgi:hypothetical protein